MKMKSLTLSQLCVHQKPNQSLKTILENDAKKESEINFKRNKRMPPSIKKIQWNMKKSSYRSSLMIRKCHRNKKWSWLSRKHESLRKKLSRNKRGQIPIVSTGQTRSSQLRQGVPQVIISKQELLTAHSKQMICWLMPSKPSWLSWTT